MRCATWSRPIQRGRPTPSARGSGSARGALHRLAQRCRRDPQGARGRRASRHSQGAGDDRRDPHRCRGAHRTARRAGMLEHPAPGQLIAARSHPPGVARHPAGWAARVGRCSRTAACCANVTAHCANCRHREHHRIANIAAVLTGSGAGDDGQWQGQPSLATSRRRQRRRRMTTPGRRTTACRHGRARPRSTSNRRPAASPIGHRARAHRQRRRRQPLPTRRFALKAPLRLVPQVRQALQAADRDDEWRRKVATAAITVASGVFVPLSHFKANSIDISVALRALADVDMLVGTKDRRPRTYQHDIARPGAGRRHREASSHRGPRSDRLPHTRPEATPCLSGPMKCRGGPPTRPGLRPPGCSAFCTSCTSLAHGRCSHRSR